LPRSRLPSTESPSSKREKTALWLLALKNQNQYQRRQRRGRRVAALQPQTVLPGSKRRTDGCRNAVRHTPGQAHRTPRGTQFNDFEKKGVKRRNAETTRVFIDDFAKNAETERRNNAETF